MHPFGTHKSICLVGRAVEDKRDVGGIEQYVEGLSKGTEVSVEGEVPLDVVRLDTLLGLGSPVSLEGEWDVRANCPQKLRIALRDHVAFIILDNVDDIEVGVEVFLDVDRLQPSIVSGVRTEKCDSAIAEDFASFSGRDLVGMMDQRVAPWVVKSETAPDGDAPRFMVSRVVTLEPVQGTEG
jgi:hypothetical protein